MFRRTLFGTLTALLVIGLTLLYLSYAVPADGLLDIRETILTLGGFATGIIILAKTWWRLLKESVKALIQRFRKHGEPGKGI